MAFFSDCIAVCIAHGSLLLFLAAGSWHEPSPIHPQGKLLVQTVALAPSVVEGFSASLEGYTAPQPSPLPPPQQDAALPNTPPAPKRPPPPSEKPLQKPAAPVKVPAKTSAKAPAKPPSADGRLLAAAKATLSSLGKSAVSSPPLEAPPSISQQPAASRKASSLTTSAASAEGKGGMATHGALVSAELRRKLTLPECGEAEVRLLLDAFGHVVEVALLRSESVLNGSYLLEEIPRLRFPPRRLAPGERVASYDIILSHEL